MDIELIPHLFGVEPPPDRAARHLRRLAQQLGRLDPAAFRVLVTG
jgi:hypothetical protein